MADATPIKDLSKTKNSYFSPTFEFDAPKWTNFLHPKYQKQKRELEEALTGATSEWTVQDLSFSSESDSEVSAWFHMNREGEEVMVEEGNILDELEVGLQDEECFLDSTPIHKTPFKLDTRTIDFSPIQAKQEEFVDSPVAMRTPSRKRQLQQSPKHESLRKKRRSSMPQETDSSSHSSSNDFAHFKKLQTMVSNRRMRNMKKDEEDLETLRDQLTEHNQKLFINSESLQEENELEELEKQITQFNAVMRDQGVCDEDVELDEIELQINRFNQNIQKKAKLDEPMKEERRGPMKEEKRAIREPVKEEEKALHEPNKEGKPKRTDIPRMNIREQLKRNYEEEQQKTKSISFEVKDKENYKNISPVFLKESTKPLIKGKSTFCPAPSTASIVKSRSPVKKPLARKILSKNNDDCKLDDIKILLMRHNSSIIKPRKT